MGEDITPQVFTREDRQRYRTKVHRCLDAFALMLAESRFDFEEPMTGMEVELNLVDAEGEPALRNSEVIAQIADPAFTTELGRFNLEINVPPRSLAGDGAATYERDVRAQLNQAESRAREIGAHMVIIGILPTLGPEHLTHDAISANPRYALLDEQMLLARGEDLHLDIRGVEDLDTYADSIAPEAACTSFQLHLQVSPEDFADHWNAAQCLAAVQVAVGANSPYLLGRELWRETRIALFTQATDTRPEELKAQGVRPRVWFGERWTTSVFDLFEENLRYFPAILPVLDPEDPMAVLEAGGTPSLHELRLHNGTVWRWNRPVYDVVGGRPHLRVENRVLPAGPTVVDMLANAAFYFGAVTALARQDRPLWSQMSFATAESNFATAARGGIDVELYWPGYGDLPVSELVLRRLLPLAHEGLREWGVDDDVRQRLLGIIEQRCASGRNGAAWQVAAVRRFEAAGASRLDALRDMTQAYVDRMHTNEPVHAWPLP
ncbi:MAG TPA: glutamate--cysteine ligase [Actinomycetes bacterium]|nr:glutamate--cysteine ligase [Actinomycetes bacterium]